MWVQYIWQGNPNDAYKTANWTPFQRGCMILGADPLIGSDVSGVSRITDTWVVDYWSSRPAPNESMEMTNGAGSGTFPSPGAAALDAVCAMGGPGGDSGTYGTGGAATGCSSWTGTWSTTFGTIRLSQSGSSVTGTYNTNSGRISGSGDFVSGTWSEQTTYQPPDHAGDFRFTMSGDGLSFKGGWRYGSTGDFSDWTGTRTCG